QGSAILNIGATLAGVLAISLSYGLLIGLRELFSSGFPIHKFVEGSLFGGEKELARVHAWGGWTVLSVFVALWMCDTAAYFVGSTLGKHKLFERVSPGKTWEGSVAGFLGAVGVMVGAREGWLGYLTITDAVILGILIGVFGQVGDLIESRFKRDAGVKDSSAIIPGHGGVYDRFDSLVFIAPIVYLYIDFVVLS
ncbi:MAG TPA: phosphatidate cytidylyltransferase, partial [Bacteroidota bacterium]